MNLINKIRVFRLIAFLYGLTIILIAGAIIVAISRFRITIGEIWISMPLLSIWLKSNLGILYDVMIALIGLILVITLIVGINKLLSLLPFKITRIISLLQSIGAYKNEVAIVQSNWPFYILFGKLKDTTITKINSILN